MTPLPPGSEAEADGGWTLGMSRHRSTQRSPSRLSVQILISVTVPPLRAGIWNSADRTAFPGGA